MPMANNPSSWVGRISANLRNSASIPVPRIRICTPYTSFSSAAAASATRFCAVDPLVNVLPNLLSAYKRVGLPEEFHTARPKRLRFLLLNTVGKVVRHAHEILLRCTKEIARALAAPPRTHFALNRPALAGV